MGDTVATGYGPLRSSLATLTDEQVAKLLREVPTLPESWAAIAHTTTSVLTTGSRRARGALRVAFNRKPDAVLQRLAAAAFFGFLMAALEKRMSDATNAQSAYVNDIDEFEPNSDDAEIIDHKSELSLVAKEAGARLGPELAELVLRTIAASSLELAEQAASMLEDLIGAARDASQRQGGVSERNDGVTQEIPDPALPVDIAPVENLLVEISSLVSAGAVITDQLEQVTAALRDGRAYEPIGAVIDSWSSRARSLLEAVSRYGAASTLQEGATLLAAEIRVHEESTKRLRKVRSAVQTLLDAGHRDMAETLAKAEGFDTLADLVLRQPDVDGVHLADAETDSDPVGGRSNSDRATEGEPGAEMMQPYAEIQSATGVDTVAEMEPAADIDSAPEIQAEPETDAGAELDESDTAAPEMETTVPAEAVQAKGVVPIDSGTAGGPSTAMVTGMGDGADTVADGETADGAPTQPETAAGDEPRKEPASAGPSAEDPVDGHVDTDTSTSDPSPAAPPAEAHLWSGGRLSAITLLVESGREAEAVHVAEAATESSGRVRLLRLFTTVTHCGSVELEQSLTELMPTGDEVGTYGEDEFGLYVAAIALATLRLGYAPASFEELAERANLQGSPLGSLVAAIAAGALRGYRHSPGSTKIADPTELSRCWHEVGQKAGDLFAALGSRTIKYPRATKVLRYLAREDQPLGHALADLAQLCRRPIDQASEVWPELEHDLREFSTPHSRDRLIRTSDEAVSTRTQLLKPIEAGAKDKLHEQFAIVSALVGEALGIRNSWRANSAVDDVQSAGAIAQALDEVGRLPQPRTVGEAALARLVAWMRAATTQPSVASLREVLSEALLVVPEIPRDAEQVPRRGLLLSEVQAILAPVSAAVLIQKYLEKGNLAQARVIAQSSGVGVTDEFDDALLRAKRTSEQRLRRLLDRAESSAARLQALQPDGVVGSVQGRLEELRNVIPDRYDLAIVPVEELLEELDTHLGGAREALRAELLAAGIPSGDADRVRGLIDVDETLAQHFLALAKLGEPLPPPEPDIDGDFPVFFPGVVDAAVSAPDDPIGAVRKHLRFVGSANDRLERGIKGWRSMTRNRRTTHADFREAVADVLRMIGLIPAPTAWMSELQRTYRAGYAGFKINASPVDYGYIPELGSQAKSFDLTVVWDPVTPTRLLEFIGDAGKTRANVILYLGAVLSPKQRQDLRRLTKQQNFSPIIIDVAVVGWLATREEPSWRITQKVTLPFTYANPYKPYAGGEVPPEVFVGRTAEQRDVIDPSGPMFVFGGRQLGKSALLRRVERLYTQPLDPEAKTRSGSVAVYIDLKAAGVQRPDQVWPLMADRLRGARVLPPGTAMRQDTVSAQLAAWFREDDRNQLLLLLDEADNFLSADAENSGGREFAALEGLKQIVETTGRRFKPVFAGLHKVQRFHNIPNTAVVHGGQEILIGPLDSMNARRLVVKPLEALGFVFESPELVWRLLLFTNYIASFIQIVLKTLVDNLSGRPLPPEGGPAIITPDDVERVCNDRQVRAQLADRFTWTIRLDNRYLVIALVTVLRSLGKNGADAYAADDLREECAFFWPLGFGADAITEREFNAYLDEMVGLGVLQRIEQGGSRNPLYTLRSRNIITMLGTPESLDRILYEATQQLELEYEYNPGLTRGMLGQSGALSARRSPLSDDDVAELLDRRTPPASQYAFVIGSAALGVGDVEVALREAGKLRDLDVRSVGLAEATELLVSSKGQRLHIVVDLSRTEDRLDPELFQQLAAQLSTRRLISATVILGPAQLPLPDWLTADETSKVLTLRRWSIAGLQAWRDSPFNTPELRQALHRCTSGWPRLVEHAMSVFETTGQTAMALKAIRSLPNSVVAARQALHDAGMDLDVARTWATWFVGEGDDGLKEGTSASTADVTEALGQDALPWLDQMQILDLVDESAAGWVLNRVSAAAASQLLDR